jgi:hypothetical protein
MPRQALDKELFKAGEKILYTGEYALVDIQGNKQDYELIALEEGETFPELKDAQAKNLCYTLNATCDESDDTCEVLGGPTPETD